MSGEVMMSENFFNSLTPHRRLLLGLESQFDYEFALASLEADYCLESYNLKLKKISHRVFVESEDFELFDSLYTEAETESQPKIVSAIKKMIDTIVKFLQNTVNMIKQKMTKVFGKINNNNLTADDFDASKTKNMMINIEYEKKLKELESQMSTGQRLIRKASSTTGIPEEELTGYKDACSKLLSDLPKVACKAAGSAAVVGGFVILSKNYKKIVSSLCSRQEAQVKKVEDTKASLKGKNPEQEKEVVTTMSSLSKKFNDIVSTISLGAMSLVNSGKNKEGSSEIPDSIKKAAMSTKGVSKADVAMGEVYSKVRDAKGKASKSIDEGLEKLNKYYRENINKLRLKKKGNHITEDEYNKEKEKLDNDYIKEKTRLEKESK